MANLLALTTGLSTRTLDRGELLLTAGEEAGGDMYILESGRLTVERDGVTLATIAEPGALIGEMCVLLGTAHSATVRAESKSTLRVIDNAVAFMERSPLVALHVATLACARLDATSALLVEMRNQASKAEQGMLSRLFGALNSPPRHATHE